MRTIDYLFTGGYGDLFWTPVIAGVAIALLGGVLSPLVVLRRLAFIGQGVSHAAFGAVGIAAIAGLAAAQAFDSLGYFAVVGGCCVAAALGISALSSHADGARAGRSGFREDTVIGVVLVGAMALGAVLLHLHARRPTGGGRGGGGGGGGPPVATEDLLFGSITLVGWADAAAAWGLALLTALALWSARRRVLFWAFDEPAAKAFGERTVAVRTGVLVALALAVVVSMKLAGVVLATALLVLPGAAALRLADRLAPVFAWSIGVAAVGVLGGLTLSFELDWPSGSTIVLVLIAVLAAAWAWSAVRGRGRGRGRPSRSAGGDRR